MKYDKATAARAVKTTKTGKVIADNSRESFPPLESADVKIEVSSTGMRGEKGAKDYCHTGYAVFVRVDGAWELKGKIEAAHGITNSRSIYPTKAQALNAAEKCVSTWGKVKGKAGKAINAEREKNKELAENLAARDRDVAMLALSMGWDGKPETLKEFIASVAAVTAAAKNAAVA